MRHASLYEIFEDAIATQGWSDNSQRVVLQRYIENQQSEAAFDDHLLQHAREVNQEHIVSSDGLEGYMGWRDRDMVRIMLEYIENQKSDDSFAVFLRQCEWINGKTFKADNGRELTQSEHGFVSGNILIDVDDLVSRDLEGVMELFAEKLVGNELLSDISYDVVGVEDGQIVMRITGDIQHILASRAENDVDGSFSP